MPSARRSSSASTAFPPLGVIVWHVVCRGDADANPGAISGARARAAASVAFLERELGAKDYVLGEFSAADVMMGFTLLAARLLGALDARSPGLGAYLERLERRPAFQRALDA